MDGTESIIGNDGFPQRSFDNIPIQKALRRTA